MLKALIRGSGSRLQASIVQSLFLTTLKPTWLSDFVRSLENLFQCLKDRGFHLEETRLIRNFRIKKDNGSQNISESLRIIFFVYSAGLYKTFCFESAPAISLTSFGTR